MESVKSVNVQTLVVLLVSLIWVIPFCMSQHFLPLLFFWQEWIAAIILATVFLFVCVRERDLSLPKVALAPVLLICVIGIQFLLHMYGFRDQLILPVLYLCIATMAAMTASHLAARGDLQCVIEGIAAASIFGGIFSVGVELAQWLGVEGTYYPYMSLQAPTSPYYANLNQPNHFAAYLASAFAALFYMRMIGKVSGIPYWLTMFLFSFGSALIGQRSVVAFVFAPFLISLFVWVGSGSRSKKDLLTSAFFPMSYVFFVWLLKLFGEHAMGKMHLLLKMSGYENRWLLFQHAWAIFKEHPLLGVGFSQFWSAYVSQVDRLGGVEIVSHPHNVFASLLAETGIIGCAVVFIPLIYWLKRVLSTPVDAFKWFGLVQLGIIGLHSMVEFPLWYVFWLVIAGFWMGALDSSVWNIHIKNHRMLAYAYFLCASIFFINFTFSYLKLRDLIFPQSFDSEQESSEFMQYRANSLAVLSEHWAFGSIASAWIAARMIPLSVENIDSTIQFNSRAMLAKPDIITLNRQVILLVLKGDIAQAVYWTKVAKKLEPASFRDAEQWQHFAKRWPERFTPEVIQRLTLAVR